MAVKNIEYLVIDVDGTMTDAGIYYDDHGNELKKFCTKDAAGFFAAYNAGLEILVLTGRECGATRKRMEELRVTYLYQNVKDKKEFLTRFVEDKHTEFCKVGYIGDDLNDYAPMSLCGFKGCPADSCSEIKEIADYVSTVPGGHGAVRDVIEYILKERGEWDKCICETYNAGI